MSDVHNVDQLIDELIGREGGYVNNPADKGGPTNFGITDAVARANGYVGDMHSMPRSVAVAIYRSIYWHRPRFDEVAKLSSRIAEELFDTGVNMGTATAAKFLQRSLTDLNRNGRDYPDLTVDGKIGDGTLSALSRFLTLRLQPIGETVLLRLMNGLQAEDYAELAEKRPADEEFLFGWISNRVSEA